MSEEVIDLVSDDDNESFGAECSTAVQTPQPAVNTLQSLPKIVSVESLAWLKLPRVPTKKVKVPVKCLKQDIQKRFASTSGAVLQKIEPPNQSSRPPAVNNGERATEPSTPLALNNGETPAAVEEPLLEEPPAKRPKVDKNYPSTSAAGSENAILFKEFITNCVKFENNEHDAKRVEEKLQSYFDKASSQYVNSKRFGDLLKAQTQALNDERLYVCLKAVLDELKTNRLSNRITPTAIAGCSKSAPSASTSSNDEDDAEKAEKSPDEQRVQKLMRAMDKVDRKVKKLEQREVDWDDDMNSSFMKMNRYRDRFTALYKKFCEVTGAPLHAESLSKKKIRFKGTNYPKVNLVIERWINKKRIFPDYSDVYNLIKSEVAELPPSMISIVAEDAFQKIGGQLQKLRKLDYWDSLQSLVSDDNDPAKYDPKLAATLEENRKLFKKKEQEKIDEFVRKQLECKDSKELEADENELSEEEEEEGKKGEEEGEKSEEEKADTEVSSQDSVDLDETPKVPDLGKTDNSTKPTENTEKTDPKNAENMIIDNDKPETSTEAEKVEEEKNTDKALDSDKPEAENEEEKNTENALHSEKIITETTDGQNSKMTTAAVKKESENGTRTSVKPFGCAGDVIVIDYCFIRYNISFETWPSLKKGELFLKPRRKKRKKNLNGYFSWRPTKKWITTKIQEILEKFNKSLLLAFDDYEADQEKQDKTNGNSDET